MFINWPIILASAMSVSTSYGGDSLPLDNKTVNSVADAIKIAEGGEHTRYPYGIKSVKTQNPRHVCINTIQHAWKDFNFEGETKGQMAMGITHTSASISLPFISFLGSRYCPPSVDSKGYHNWTNNVFRIYNKQKDKQ